MDSSLKRFLVFSLLQLGTNFHVSADCTQTHSISYNCAANSQISETQCQTLVNFYCSTNGDDWANSSSNIWLTDSKPCNWEGVICWGNRVVRLEAPGYGLSGELPDLSGLSHLMQIALFNNPYLGGTLPDLTPFKDLTHVVVFNTSIRGFLPDVASMPALTELVVHNCNFVGPIPDVSGLSNVVLFGNDLCLSPRVDYSIASMDVSSYSMCQPMLTNLLQGVLDVTEYGAIADDGCDDHQAINNMLTKIQLSLPSQKNVSDLTILFPEGDYDLEGTIKLVGFDGLTLEGEMFSSIPSRILKSADFANNRVNGLIGSPRLYAMFDFSFGDGLTVQNLEFEGQTTNTSVPTQWWDDCIYVGSSYNTRIKNNRFSHFGDAALIIVTHPEDTSEGINSGKIEVSENYFYNVVQTSTTSVKGGSSNYSFMNNVGVHMKGSFKFATRVEGASNLNILNNTVISAGTTSGITTNNGFEIEGYSNVLVSGNTISNGQGVGISLRSSHGEHSQGAYNWGNVSIANNRITDYRQAVYISNLPDSNNSLAVASNIDVSSNQIENMWNQNQGVIHFVGKQFSQCSATYNTISGNIYSVWYGSDQQGNILVEGNVLMP